VRKLVLTVVAALGAVVLPRESAYADPDPPTDGGNCPAT
jgi:hypothetical protein